MSTTIFEKIVADEIPCHKVYEDDEVLGFLDINPDNKGHSLIIPKQHFPDIYEIPNDLLGKMMSVAKKVAKRLNKVTDATGIKIVMNNGSDAGQIIFHAHIHVIPFFGGGSDVESANDEGAAGDEGVAQNFSEKYEYKEGEAEELAKTIFQM